MSPLQHIYFIMIHIRFNKENIFLHNSSNTEPPAAKQLTAIQSKIKSILPLDILFHA